MPTDRQIQSAMRSLSAQDVSHPEGRTLRMRLDELEFNATSDTLLDIEEAVALSVQAAVLTFIREGMSPERAAVSSMVLPFIMGMELSEQLIKELTI